MTVTLGPTKLLLLGTFDEYIHSASFHPLTGRLRAGEATKSSMKPTWLTQHPMVRDIVYSNGHTEGEVFCWRVTDRASGHLEPLGEAITGGEAPTHMAVLKDGSALVVAHFTQYRSGTTTVVPLLPDGSFANSGPLAHYAPVPSSVTFTNIARQGAPHAHQVLLGAGPSEVYVTDLGYNRVEHLSVSARHATALEPFDGFLDADGPRHAALHPGGTHLYTLREMSSTILVHRIDKPGSPVARHSILPQGTAPEAKPLAAALNILPAIRSGGPHLLIASNRDLCRETGDTVALFPLEDDGAMKLLRHLEVPARHLRGVAVDAENRWVCVAGRHGGGIIVLERVGEDSLDLAIRATLPDVKQVIAPMW